MIVHLLDHTATTLTYLAGLSGDGTKNNSVAGIVSKIIQLVGWAGAGVFTWRLLQHYWKPAQGGAANKTTGGGMTTETSREIMHEAVTFAVFEGVLAVVWQLLNAGQGFFYGMF